MRARRFSDRRPEYSELESDQRNADTPPPSACTLCKTPWREDLGPGIYRTYVRYCKLPGFPRIWNPQRADCRAGPADATLQSLLLLEAGKQHSAVTLNMDLTEHSAVWLNVIHRA